MDSIDVEEIKYALIDNPVELAKNKWGKLAAHAQKELNLAQENQKMYGELKSLIHYYTTYRTRLMSDLESKLHKFKYALENGKNRLANNFGRPGVDSSSGLQGELSSEQKATKRKIEDLVDKIQKIVDRIEAFLKAVPQDDKDLLDIIRSVNQSNWGEGGIGHVGTFGLGNMQFDSWTTNHFRENFSGVKKAEKQILFARNLTIHDDLSELKTLLDSDVESKKAYIELIRSDDNWQNLLQHVHEEMAKRSEIRGEIHEQIGKFKKLNLLLSYKSDNVDKDVCALPEVECCEFNADAQVVQELEYRNSDGGTYPYLVAVETQNGVEKLPVVDVEPLTIEEDLELIDQESPIEVSFTNSFEEALDALRIMVDLTEGEQRQEYIEAVEAMEVMLELETAA
jgi:hypothetical protein